MHYPEAEPSGNSLIKAIDDMNIRKEIRTFKKFVKLHLLDEYKYKCPFCNHVSKELSPIGLDFPVLSEKQVIGAGKRLGGCMKCGSTDRERLVYIYLKEKTKIFKSGKSKNILHVSPEEKLLKIFLDYGFEKYVCGDSFMDDYYSYPDCVTYLSLLDIPYPDNMFDFVICNHVLQYIPDDIRAMKEIHRVLKPDLLAILQVPISKNSEMTFENFSIKDPKERRITFGDFTGDAVRIYGQDYTDRLESSGFKVRRMNISKEFSTYGLNQDEDIFVCKKQI